MSAHHHKLHHDEYECLKCGGHERCRCKREPSPVRRCEEKRECRPCKLPCNKKEALRVLRVEPIYRSKCSSFLERGTKIYDPFLISKNCWYKPCYVQKGECRKDCDIKSECESSLSSSSSCSSEERVCIMKVTPAKPRCCQKKCGHRH